MCGKLDFVCVTVQFVLKGRVPFLSLALPQPPPGTDLHECTSGCSHPVHQQEATFLHAQLLLYPVGKECLDVTSEFAKDLSSILETYIPLSDLR